MNYWLVKSEPDDFSLDDLKKKGREPWTGVRNYQARNFMRDGMAPGDLALFYHSNIAPPGVVGLAKVDSDAYPDPTQFDAKSHYYDPTSSPDNPRWMLRDLIYEASFKRFVSLPELRECKDTAGMRVCQKGARLSVQPVTEAEFKAVCKLAGYTA